MNGLVILQAEWALFEFQGAGGDLAVSTDSPLAISYHNYTWVSTHGPQGSAEQAAPTVQAERQVQPGNFSLKWRDGPGFLGVRGDLRIVLDVASLELDALAERAPLSQEGWGDDMFSSWVSKAYSSQVYVVGTSGAVGFSGTLESFETLGALAACEQEVCLTGGRTETQTLGPLRIQKFDFERVLPNNGLASFNGKPAHVFVGGSIIDVDLVGRARLPRAAAACDCIPPDSTLTLDGALTLRELRPQQDTMRSALSGESVQVLVDEQELPFTRLLSKETAVVATASAAALAVLFTPLFTRLSKKEALEHPKRQKIFQYIQEHPGANFREVARNTQIAAGTVRHHLTVLERAGHLVEHPHNGTVRLFENHGKFDHNWSDMVLLREPPLAKVHSWLKEHPQSPQKDVLEAMELEGWSRSTTQHRLARLVEGGLATIRLQGRLKIYSATQSAPPRQPFLLQPVAQPAAPALART